MRKTDKKLNKGRFREYFSTVLALLIVLIIIWFLINGSSLQKRVFNLEQNITLQQPLPTTEPTEPEETAAPETTEAPTQPPVTEERLPSVPQPTRPPTEPTAPAEQDHSQAPTELPSSTLPADNLDNTPPAEGDTPAESARETDGSDYVILSPGTAPSAGTVPDSESETQSSDDDAENDPQVLYYPTALLPKNFKMYSQLDYPDQRIGTGTVATNGCGITALAMVATYMTGHEYSPDTLARWFGGKAENNIARIEIAATALRLPWYQAENWLYVAQALREGKIVIQLENRKSRFTTSQHFLVLLGYTPEGKVIAVDPYPPNYEKWDLKTGFAQGFPAGELIAGYDGAWIFDLPAMPEEPFIYEPEPRPDVEPRYPDVQLTEAEEELLARLIFVEARGEIADGQQAVAEIVLNRLISDRFPNNIRDIIYGAGQFVAPELLSKAEPSQAQYEAIENALLGPYVIPQDVCFYSRNPETRKIWGKIGGHYFTYEP